jgi:chromosome segregation ATPase
VERARAAEQKAKQADELKTALDAKTAALLAAEEQLRQERAVREEVEGQLRQERAALADARSTLEQERSARETAQKSLEARDADVSKLEGELVALSITSADQEMALKEQSATVVSLQQAVEADAAPSRWRRSRLKVGHRFVSCFADLSFEGSFPF